MAQLKELLVSGDAKVVGSLYANAATTSKDGLMSSTDKTKLDGIETGAQVNDIESISVNGTAQTISSKAVNIIIPNFTGADGTNAGTSGFVPAPSAGDNGKYLKGDGTWGTPSGGGGSIEVGLNNATNGGLTITGSPVSGSGTMTIGHTNVLQSAQTTQALYPITVDINGHITAMGSAVSVQHIFYSDNEPSSANTGDVWYDIVGDVS